MFDIVADRRGGKMPAQIDPRHVAYGPVAIALARQFRRAFNARDAGDTAEQFHRDERVAQRARDERAFAAVVEDTQAAIERRALNSGGARRVRVPTVPA